MSMSYHYKLGDMWRRPCGCPMDSMCVCVPFIYKNFHEDLKSNRIAELEQELQKYKNAMIQNQQLQEQVDRLQKQLNKNGQDELLPCPFCSRPDAMLGEDSNEIYDGES